MVVEGIEYFGVRNIMTAQLADPAATGFITRNFTSGRILLHFAGLPAAALAMYHSAKKENRKKLRSLLIPVTLTCMLIGVTEPLEFTFVYTAPILYYLIHVPLAGLSYVLTEVLNVSIYGFAVWNMWPNLLQPGKVHAMALLFLLPLYFGLYYVSFKWGIKQFKAAVPGQGVDKSVKLYSKKDYHAAKTEAQSVANNGAGGAPTDTTTSESVQVDTDGVKQVTPAEVTAQAEPPTLALRIIEALGGAKNIENVTNCATRLRVTLYDGTLVAPKEIWQNTLDARGIIIRESGVQVIYGTQVEGIARSVKTELDME